MTDRTTYVSLAGVRLRGWTDAMVRDLLGTPDMQGRDPRRWSLAPVRLYLLARVETVERTPEFAETAALCRARASAAGVHAERRRAAVLAAIRAEPIEVPLLPRPELERRAVRHRHLLGARSPGPGPAAAPGPAVPPGPAAAPGGAPAGAAPAPASGSMAVPPPAGALVRWQVSYLRHALSRYEALLDGLYGEAGRGEAERLLRRRLYEAIAAAYPSLAGECRRRIVVER
ncbi:hypothetical protein EDD98_4284 [Streptomyces sp. PanSC19]|uniref:hypothetical protein n=1 Tax=Streptomyces sp. PanSC19 TaxID=1520455 RepID=UPI000F461D7F|nr:hypothetical protein [Streptomyces sp. PanSC19]ROQ35230.1 hypothetical protein EDD98_4284 [Streptomyces sp. PanSC19]